MSAPLDEQYLTWLYSQVGSVKLRNSSRTHWSLLKQLYKKEFVWFIPNDDNRVADGRELRYEFVGSDYTGEIDPDWMDLGCSMLEMLMALSRRLAFESDDNARQWFWHLIEVLDLFQFNDRNYDNLAEEQIDDTLNRVIFRRYSPNGHGGLFPLRRTEQDQRDVEIWYQMCSYLIELEPI